MNIEEILSKTDHTLLLQTAVWDDIKLLCDEALKYKTASVCVPPCFVKEAKNYLSGKIHVCTVVGFPNGYSTAETKAYETKQAVENGADEIDMVINIGYVKSKKFDLIEHEIEVVRSACVGKILKVIIETCLLTDNEKIKLCEIVSSSNADFIKTSTGFSSGGATFEDIKLIKASIKPHLKIKASGGISSVEDAEKFIALGADRLGTSKIVKIVKQQEVI